MEWLSNHLIIWRTHKEKPSHTIRPLGNQIVNESISVNQGRVNGKPCDIVVNPDDWVQEVGTPGSRAGVCLLGRAHPSPPSACAQSLSGWSLQTHLPPHLGRTENTFHRNSTGQNRETSDSRTSSPDFPTKTMHGRQGIGRSNPLINRDPRGRSAKCNGLDSASNQPKKLRLLGKLNGTVIMNKILNSSFLDT